MLFLWKRCPNYELAPFVMHAYTFTYYFTDITSVKTTLRMAGARQNQLQLYDTDLSYENVQRCKGIMNLILEL